MAEKLSWSELRRALASRADVSEKNAGLFLNALVGQLIEGLKSDKQVKINGLGTFKLQAVAPRKSVDVSTGEEIIIEGYNKIVFTPEAGLKELVESSKEAEYPIDPIKKLGEQADEIVGLLADLGEVPSGEEPEAVVEEPEPVVEEPEAVVEEPEPVVETEPEPVVETEPEPVVEEPQHVVVENPTAVVIEKEPEIIVQQPEKPKKKRHFLRDVLICLVILLLLLVGCYFFLRQELSGWMEKLLEPKAQTEQVEPTPGQIGEDSLAEKTAEDPELALIPEGEISQEQILEEWLAITGDEDLEPKAGPYTDLIKTELMHKDSRLAWMSKRFYGDKRFWPYLYDANRDRIENPSQVEVGTPIRVPRLTAEQLDTTNEASMAILKQLTEEAERAINER